VLIRVSRDSVAAGDDTSPHDYTLDVDPKEALGALLARLTPDINVRGPAAWAVRLSSDGQRDEYVAVYSADLGGMRVVRRAEQALGSFGQPSLYFCYFSLAPAELLLAAVERGEEPDRDALTREGRRRHLMDEEARAEREQATSTGRLLSKDAVAAITELGGQVSPHSGDYARVDGHAATWLVTRDEWWHRVNRFDNATGLTASGAHFKRPGAFLAEPFLVACVGAERRAAAGLPPALLPPRVSTELKWHQWHWAWPGPDGPFEAQSMEEDLAVVGASVAGMGVAAVVAAFS